jgi:hypothetical protein
MNQMVENMRSDSLSMSPDAMALKNWKFDQEVSREAMVNFNLSIITLQKYKQWYPSGQIILTTSQLHCLHN